nr:F-box/LRR-repeat protein 8-like isoform X1 [Lytechinus pictus]XP_054748487.1 F-box/LRR-repeat protein 8-like isoform X2 [Lytechinus pictus]
MDREDEESLIEEKEDGEEEESLWSNLPNHILVYIFSFLNLSDRCQASLTCKAWSEIFGTPSLWRKFKFCFFTESDSCQLKCLDLYGSQLRNVCVVLNQKGEDNRKNACEVINRLAECPDRRLQDITVQFTTDNPLFFKGSEFLNSLALLFGPPAPSVTMHHQLRKIDLSQLELSISDIMLALIANNHPNLEVLNIQNHSINCHISTEHMLDLVRKCKKLRELSTFYKSVSDDVFKAFADADHARLEYLSLACRREEKYHKLLSADAWDILVASSPKLRVSLLFDHTIERHQIRYILHPQIPLTELAMRTMSELHHEVGIVASFYPRTLEVFIVVTKGSESFKTELMRLVSTAPHLRVLHCFCGLDVDTIAKIKELCPNLEESTLKTEDDFNEMQRVFVGRAARNTVMSGR